MSETLLRPRTLGFVLLAVLIILFPFLHTWPFFEGFIGPFRTFQATMFAVWLLVVLGMNLLTGYSGQISLGHAALVAVGAYITAILFNQFGVPLGLAILIAGLATGVLGGVIIGVPAVRLSGPYLAIATFSLIVALPQILKMDIEVAGLTIDLTEWTKGTRGISIGEIQPPEAVDGLVDQRQWLYYMSILPAVLMTFLAWNLIRSRIGRAFVALRDSEVGAEQMGVNVRLYKALAFGISSCYAGVGGGLFVMAQTIISPGSMDLLTSINFLVAIVIGGLATVLGSIIGALYLTYQGELVSNVVAPLLARIVPGGLVQDPQTLRGVIFGSILIITIISFPRGLAALPRAVTGLVQDLASGAESPYPMTFRVEYPRQLSPRLVFLKWLLVMPHIVILYALGFAAGVAIFIAWFSILFTRRYPRGLFEFVVNVNRWSANVLAYVSLMRDEYPPFSWERGQYPVTYEVEYPPELNRWLIFVKGLLLVPHALLLYFLYLAYAVTVVIAGFGIVLTKRYPETLFRFGLGVLRWNSRVNVYASLLRDEYPPFGP